MNNANDHRILNELYVQACRALLSDYGLEVSVQEHGGGSRARNKTSFVSVLGANSEGIRLSSMLKIERDLVVRMHPLSSGKFSQPDLEDWCLELNNQLVGRVKNKLLGYGHAVLVGLPVLLTGTDVSAVIPPHSEVHHYSAESAEGRITVSLATYFALDVELRELETSIGEEDVLLEGSVALF